MLNYKQIWHGIKPIRWLNKFNLTAFEVFSADHSHQLDYGPANWIWKLHEDGFNFYQIKHQENVKQHDWEK